MKAFKGFNKDLTCRGYQYEAGKTYTEDCANLCQSGFHACERPLDVFSYYGPASSVYHEVEMSDVSDQRESNDIKIVGKTIRIGAALDIAGLCKAQFEYVKSHTTHEQTAGNRGAATAGDCGAATAGDCGAATAGDCGAATSRGSSSVGENGIACARGNSVKIKGGIGAILVIGVECNDSYNLKEWKAVVVDGKTIKANTWYALKDGEIIECDEGSGND